MIEEQNKTRGALTVGDKFPDFTLPACVSNDKSYGDNFKNISLSDSKGKWRVIFFWPLDFTFICPTEIVDFNNHLKDFEERGAVLLGASCDSEHVHLAWQKEHAELKKTKFPWLADYNKTLAGELGIIHKQAGAPLRATYIIDPDGVIKSVFMNDLSVGRNPSETLRIRRAMPRELA